MNTVSRTQKVLLFVIGALLCLPGPMLSLFSANPALGDRHPWLANRTLEGVVLPRSTSPLTAQHWLEGKYQSSVTTWFNENFGGRELLIRVNNQILYSLFRVSTMSAGKLIVGRRENLFEEGYLLTYGGWNNEPDDAKIRALAESARRVQDLLARRGVPFVVLISPSKADFQADSIPARYLRRGAPAKTAPTDERFVAAGQRLGVHFVDGRALTRQAERELGEPAFPTTGIHWTKPAAFFTLRALVEEIARQQGGTVPRIEMFNLRPEKTSDGGDSDLARLLNLVSEPTSGRYLRAQYRGSGSAPRPAPLTFVGGSFVWTLLDVLGETQVFPRVRTYYYYKLGKFEEPGRVRSDVDEARIPWNEDFGAAGAVVLEVNQGAFGGGHLAAFLAAATTKLGGSDEAGFTFGKGGNSQSVIKRGLTPQTEEGFAWTDQRESEMELPITIPPGQSAEVVVQARPLLGRGVDERVVTIQANGQAVGEWRMRNGDFAEYRVTVPAELVARQATLRLVFSTEPIQAPGTDTRKLGLAFRSVAVRPGEPASAKATQSQARLTFGKGGSAQAAIKRGFTPLTEDGFTWTDQRIAELELPVPPASVGALELTANLRPLLGRGLTERSVRVQANGRSVGEWKITEAEFADYRLTIPAEIVSQERSLRLTFDSEPIQAPGNDTRKLGLAFRIVSTRPADLAAENQKSQPINLRLAFGKGGSAQQAIKRGFTPLTEDGFTWTDQREAELEIPLGANAGSQVELVVDARPMLSGESKERTVQVQANGQVIGEWKMRDPAFSEYRLRIPGEVFARQNTLRLVFSTEPTQAPGTDTRKIGIAFRTLTLR